MGKGEKTKFEKEETTNKRTKMCSGRTWSYGRHRHRVPLGKIWVECRCRSERCRSQCHGGPNPKQIKKKKNEEMGKCEKIEFEGRNKKRMNKAVQWTYCMLWSSPLPCSTQKDLNWMQMLDWTLSKNAIWWTQSKTSQEEEERRNGEGWENRIRRKKQRTKEQRSAVDVLLYMVVTFVVFHWERSELNTDADRNAVEVNPKQVKKKKNEEMGKGEKTEFEERNNERKTKDVK